jgi:hypothetical protein
MKIKLIWILGLLGMFLLGILVSTLSTMVQVKRDEIVLAEDLRTLNGYYKGIIDPDIYLGDPVSISNAIVHFTNFFDKYPSTLCLIREQQTSEELVPVFVVLPTVSNHALGILWNYGMAEAFSPQSSGFSSRVSEMFQHIGDNQYVISKNLCPTNRVMVLSKGKFLTKAMKYTGYQSPLRIGGDK